ncbi:hypothetical protein WMY93_025741 [Mugilogobius chulae]|uniref:Uncharacterized protein n=1 Tax=Mugilogobius chulae TaxID=88201 RepID=A0AAW0N186_9GOBI
MIKRSDELESRVQATEDSRDSLSTSLSDIASKVESLLSKSDTCESKLAAQSQAAEQAKTTFEQEIVALKTTVQKLQSSLTVADSQVKLVSEDSGLSSLVEDLSKRLEVIENSSAGSVRAEQLESLQSLVSSLERKAAKLEGHEEAISALQTALQETTQTLASLSTAPGVTKNMTNNNIPTCEVKKREGFWTVDL